MSSNSFLRRLLVLTVGAIFSITGVARAQSTAAFAPIPITTVLAGSSAAVVAAGTCSTGITNPITTFNFGDGCTPANATIISITDVAIDSEGNVYWSDTGGTVSTYTSYGSIRVLYKGGSVAANLIFGANSWNPNFTAKFASASAIQASGTGLVFSVEQGISGLITVKSGSTYSCGNAAGGTYGYLGYDSVGDGCPAGTLRGAPRAIAVDKYGNVFFIAAASTGSASNSWQPRVIFAGGGSSNPVYNLITTLNSGVTPTAGYAYSLGFQANAAGSGYVGPYGDGGLATGASLMYPRAIAVDSKENVYITDAFNGSVGYGGTQGGGASGAENIREIFGSGSKIGYVTTVAGETACGGDYYDSNGNLVSLSIGESSPPSAAGVLGTGSVYFHNSTTAQSDCPTTPNGTSLTFTDAVAGNGDPAAAAPTQAGGGNYTSGGWFYYPTTIWLDAYDNLYIAENGNTRIRVVYRGGPFPSQITSTPVVGDIYTYVSGQGISTSYRFAGEYANVISTASGGGGADALGNIYAYDTGNGYFWKVDPSTYTVYKYGGIGSATLAASGGYCLGGTSGPKATDAIGSGCPATWAKSGVGYSTSAGPAKIVGDNAGNLYMVLQVASTSPCTTSPYCYGVVQELSLNNQFTATADGSTTKQYVAFENVYNPLVNSTGGSVALSGTSTGITFGLQGSTDTEFSLDTGTNVSSCSGSSTPSFQNLCAEYVDFKPTHPGQRSATINFAGTSSVPSTGTVVSAAEALVGVGTAADLAIDTGTASTIGTGLMPTGVAADLNGNVYVADSTGNQILKGASSGNTLTTLISGLSSPSQVATGNAGNLYVADTGNNRVLVTNAAGTTIVSVTGSGSGTALSAPKGVAVDPLGNIYVADTGNSRIVRLTYAYQVATTSYLSYIAPVALFASSGTAITLSSPTQLAFDASGNLYIVDSGNSRIVEVPSVSNGGTSNVSVVTLDGGVVPDGIALDAAGDLYVADSAGKVLEYYLGATPGTAVLSGLTTPVGLAVDANAQIFVADSSATGLTADLRSTGYTRFTASGSQSLTLNNVGNAALTLSSTSPTPTGTNASAFSLAANTCTTSGLAIGGACTETATFTSAGGGTYTASASFATNAADAATVSLNGSITVPATTTAIGTITPSSPTYGQSVSVPVTVTGTSGSTPTGNVTLNVNGTAYATQALSVLVAGTSGTTTFSVTGLPAQLDSFSASYAGDGSNAASVTTTSGSVTVSQASQTISFTAPTTPVTYGASSVTLVASSTSSLAVVFTIDSSTTSGVCSVSGTNGTTLTFGSAGNCIIDANQSGNTNYAAATEVQKTVVINQATQTITGFAPSSPVTYGVSPITLSATGGASTNPVTFSIKSGSCGSLSGTNNSTLTITGACSLTVAADQAGNTNYTAATEVTASIIVNKATLTVTANSFNIAYGATDPTYTDTITGFVNGDTSAVVSGAASLTTTPATPSATGSYPITAAIGTLSAANYSFSFVNGTLSIGLGTSTASLSTSLTNVQPGQALTLTATVSGSGAAPTGTVTFTSTSTGATQGVLGTATLVNGVATYYGLVWAGTDSITAIYNGDSNYSGSTSNAVTVTNASVTGTLQFNWPGLNWAQGVSYGASSAAWPVTLQNLTGVTVTPTIGIANSNFVISGSTCGTLTQGATCIFYVTFTPTSGGSATGTKITSALTATTSTPAQDASIPVSGIAFSSALTFNWPALNFTPTVAVGATSSPWPVTMRNQSGTATTVNSITVPDASYIISNDNCTGQQLAAFASCMFNVTFSPIAADVTTSGTNILSGTLTATGNSGSVTGSLAVGGWAATALGFNWPGVNFQGVSQGSTGTNPWPVIVTNYSGSALTGLSYTFTGVSNYQSGAFVITDPNDCFGNTLASGASCLFNVVPTPQSSQSLGAYSATLAVSGTAGASTLNSYALTVSGYANAGGLAINWNQNQQGGVSTIDFGPQNKVNSTSGPWPITVYNNTPTAQTLTITPSLSQFTTDVSTLTNVPAGGSAVFNLYFTPTAATSYQGTLTVTGTGCTYTFNTWGSAHN